MLNKTIILSSPWKCQWDSLATTVARLYTADTKISLNLDRNKRAVFVWFFSTIENVAWRRNKSTFSHSLSSQDYNENWHTFWCREQLPAPLRLFKKIQLEYVV